MKFTTDTILPTTMVGSYPRPRWFTQQLDGRDIRVAFKSVEHAEAFDDATRLSIRDQEEAGLDIVTDGQMYFDDIVGVIGSFCWYWYERLPGFEEAKEEHPLVTPGNELTKELAFLSDWGGVINSGPVGPGPTRLADFYKAASEHATRPMKVSVGAGPVNLAWHVYYKHYQGPRDISEALAPIFNAEMKALVAAGANFLQLEDLGVWLPLFTGNNDDFKWIVDVIRQCVDGVDAKIALHFCYGNAWGNRLAGLFPRGYEAVLPFLYEAPVDQFVLDFANRDMVDLDSLRDLPPDKEVGIGVVDVRTSMVETPQEIAERIRKVIAVVPPERVYLTTDCGMKPLARPVARMKLAALAKAAQMVRQEVGVKQLVTAG
jgi:5-methyltetrahydropteroyltriglutamate--homocysteine methyltransferase